MPAAGRAGIEASLRFRAIARRTETIPPAAQRSRAGSGKGPRRLRACGDARTRARRTSPPQARPGVGPVEGGAPRGPTRVPDHGSRCGDKVLFKFFAQ